MDKQKTNIKLLFDCIEKIVSFDNNANLQLQLNKNDIDFLNNQIDLIDENNQFLKIVIDKQNNLTIDKQNKIDKQTNELKQLNELFLSIKTKYSNCQLNELRNIIANDIIIDDKNKIRLLQLIDFQNNIIDRSKQNQ